MSTNESQVIGYMKSEKGGKILRYNNCPYLIFMNLNTRIVIAFQVFKVKED